MEICPAVPIKGKPPQSIIVVKNKIRLGHDECCNCCCCSSPQPMCYRYMQPKIPKSFAPIRSYMKPDIPMDDNTTYKLSYWEGPQTMVTPFKPEDSLTVSKCPLTDDTTHKLSYMGNWCITPEKPILPCSRKWLGEGPMQCCTTQKCDFTWKNIIRTKPYKTPNNLYRPCAVMNGDTTYRLSYFNSNCLNRVKPFKPIRRYMKSNMPMDDCTTYKLSYWPNRMPSRKMNHPWNMPIKYIRPVNKMDSCTTYNLSYWPHCEKRRDPISKQDTENLLNAGCCLDDNTTYKLSYFGCGGDRRQPIKQSENIHLSPCPLTYDTVNRLSYLGNWCFKPESSMKPCSRDWLGKGPMQRCTTQNSDYCWKYKNPVSPIRQKNNLKCSSKPLECCTTQRLSFMENDPRCFVPIKSFAPIRIYEKSAAAMDTETVQRLSFQPVEPVEKVENPLSKKPSYHPPTTIMEENTTYNLSYIPPGTVVPLENPCEITCEEPCSVPCPMSMPRPCVPCGSS